MKKLRLALILVLYIFGVGLTTQQVTGEEWSEDFSNDLSQWQVNMGEFIIENGALKANDMDTPTNSIYRNNSDSYGTWTVSVNRDDPSQFVWVYPIALDMEENIGEPIEGVIIGYDFDKFIQGDDLDESKATISLITKEKPVRLNAFGQYTAEDQLLGWHSFLLERNNLNEYRLYMDGELIIGPVKSYAHTTSEYFNINSRAGVMYDDISFSPEFTYVETPITSEPESTAVDTKTDNDNEIFGMKRTQLALGAGIISILSVSSALTYTRYIKPGPIFDGELYGPQHQYVKELFQSQTILYYTLVGQTRGTDDDTSEILKNAIPRDIFEFKYLLHPVRLSFMKLLYESLEMTSIEIKDILEIKWNEYFAHLKILKKNKLVRVEEKFRDGYKRQVLTLNEKGIEEYRTLVDLLHVFLDNSIQYKTYIEQAQSKLKDKDRDTYPPAS